MEIALYLRLFNNSCVHPQWLVAMRVGFNPKVLGSYSAKDLLFPFFLLFFFFVLFCFLCLFVLLLFIFKCIPK